MSTPTIHVHKMWTEYVQDPKDAAKFIEKDWVAYGPVGQLDRSVTIASVKSLQRLHPLNSQSNPAVMMAHDRWAQIEPHYNAWKSGQETPVDGTPLAAWAGVTPEQAEIFKVKGLRTVEEIAGMTDSLIVRIPLPRVREIVESAKRFIASADTVRYAQELQKKDEQIKNQDLRITEQADQIEAQKQDIAKLLDKVDKLADAMAEAHAAPQAAPQAAPKGKVGRPRKQPAITEAA